MRHAVTPPPDDHEDARRRQRRTVQTMLVDCLFVRQRPVSFFVDMRFNKWLRFCACGSLQQQPSDFARLLLFLTRGQR